MTYDNVTVVVSLLRKVLCVGSVKPGPRVGGILRANDPLYIIHYTLSIIRSWVDIFIEGLFPLASEAHCGYTSLHKYVITIYFL